MSLIISLIIVVALALLFTWLAVRASHARRAVIKWPGVVVSGLLAVLCAAVASVGALGYYKLDVAHGCPAPDIQVNAAPEMLTRGEHLANLCASCHSTTTKLPLDGGKESFISGIGTLYAPNLTPGGPLKDWSDGQIIRAIRQGVDKDGHALLIMPAEYFHHLSDDDVRSLVAYLRAQPAVNRQTPANEMNLIGTALVGAGLFPTTAQEPITSPVVAPTRAPTSEYGRYLVKISGCQTCHGTKLTGGTPGGFVPAGPNLPALISHWSADQFVTTLRTGVNPSGHSVSSEMPWRELSAAYGDDELTAIYQYLRGLSPTTGSAG